MTRRHLISCICILLLTAGLIFGIDRVGKGSRVFGHTGNIAAASVIKKVVDNPTEAYRIWKSAGYRGRTLVSISDRWETFDPGKLISTEMYRAYPLRLYNTARLLEDEHLDDATFLYVALMNNICRRIVAVLPEGELERMKKSAITSKDYRLGEKDVFISRQGVPRWFTSNAATIMAGEPVLLYVGASYFKHAEPEGLYRQLSAAGLQTDCVVLCTEVGKEGVTEKEISRLNTFARLIGIPGISARSEHAAVPTPGADAPRSLAHE